MVCGHVVCVWSVWSDCDGFHDVVTESKYNCYIAVRGRIYSVFSFNLVNAGLLFDPVQVILGPGEAGRVAHLTTNIKIFSQHQNIFTSQPELAPKLTMPTSSHLSLAPS